MRHVNRSVGYVEFPIIQVTVLPENPLRFLNITVSFPDRFLCVCVLSEVTVTVTVNKYQR